MNWLAHILLSRRDIEFQLGNLLADPLKAKPWQGANQNVINGMLMHKSIDAFTDAHPVISLSKSRLNESESGNAQPAKKGYLKGVVVDILFDHFLAKSWNAHAAQSLSSFIDDFNNQAANAVKAYPERPKNIVTRIIESDRIRKYSSFSEFINVLYILDKRLSDRIKQKDSAQRYIKLVEDHYDDLYEDFDAFFPDLIAFFLNHKLGSKQDHFLRAEIISEHGE